MYLRNWALGSTVSRARCITPSIQKYPKLTFLQIVQRVDIIQEDHGKAILVFTIVSTIFLPLSFVSSYMGMNTSDIRDMEPSQALFWQAATPFTVVVVATVLVVAYNIHRIQRWLPRGPAVL